MAADREWSAKIGEKLELPENVRKRLKYKVIMVLGRATEVVWCHSFTVDLTGVNLEYVLADTSTWFQGKLMVRRLSLRENVHLVNVPLLITETDGGSESFEAPR